MNFIFCFLMSRQVLVNFDPVSQGSTSQSSTMVKNTASLIFCAVNGADTFIAVVTFKTTVFSLLSCNSEDDFDNYHLVTIPIDEAIVPSEFEFGLSYDITIKFSFPNGCHTFYSLPRPGILLGVDHAYGDGGGIAPNQAHTEPAHSTAHR